MAERAMNTKAIIFGCEINFFMKYFIIIRKTKYGYDVQVPALPGCVSQGDTEEEAIENTKDAIISYVTAENEEIESAHLREIEVNFAFT